MNYTLILQNTVSKDITLYNLEDFSTGVYHKFEIELQGEKDGEYEYILFKNEEKLPVKINQNNVFESKPFVPTILVTYTETLTSNTKILCTADYQTINPTFGLLVIGDYEKSNLTYNKTSKYTVYERK
jgi:hypothetical protein